MAGLSPSLAIAIRRRREAAGISQEELADRASLHRTYISLVERARRNLSVDALDRIAVALGVPASRLLAEAEGMRSRGRTSPP
jgi:transcriptional regulator with XRE-family HTH domain